MGEELEKRWSCETADCGFQKFAFRPGSYVFTNMKDGGLERESEQTDRVQRPPRRMKWVSCRDDNLENIFRISPTLMMRRRCAQIHYLLCISSKHH